MLGAATRRDGVVVQRRDPIGQVAANHHGDLHSARSTHIHDEVEPVDGCKGGGPKAPGQVVRVQGVVKQEQRPPGSDRSGAVDYDQIKAWIDEAQRLLDIEDRREAGDGHIGRLLSAAPPDPTDAVAPPIAIRQLLEQGQTPELEDGLGSGLLMGPTAIRSGWAGELVAESQQAHQQAQRDATTIAARWPRTARLLREVADAHRHQARHWQDDASPID